MNTLKKKQCELLLFGTQRHLLFQASQYKHPYFILLLQEKGILSLSYLQIDYLIYNRILKSF